MPEARDEKRPCAPCKPRYKDIILATKRVRGNAAEIRNVGNARQQFRNSLFEDVHFGIAGHQDFLESSPCSTRSITPVVDCPATSGSASTLPPQPSTSFCPTMLAVQSAPLTRTSG